MPTAVYVPRVNNNDDEVQLRALDVSVGDQVSIGDNLGAVETDKAVVEIEAESAGFVLFVAGEEGDTLTVGSTLMWIGETADESIPAQATSTLSTSESINVAPTAKAKLLLKKFKLKAEDVPRTGERLSASDVQAYIDSKGMKPVKTTSSTSTQADDNFPPPAAEGQQVPLTPEQKGMVNTVSWHRDCAAAGYIELEYETADWEAFAAKYAEKHKLLMSPLIPLMAYRLVEIVKDNPVINTTLYHNQRFEYANVNLGFTVQAGASLYLPVLHKADTLSVKDFLLEMGDLQRKANGHKLSAEQLQGASVSFSSMARWQVSRHIPILPPYTSLIIAHAKTQDGKSSLGASYDHRVLSGFEVTMVLRELSKPPADAE